MQIAVCGITFPPAPQQPIPQQDRLVNFIGTASDGEIEVSAQEQRVIVRATPQATVVVSIRERLQNGAISGPVSLTFTPWASIQANAATGEITVDVSVEDIPDTDPPVA
jgi:hypothetical protein